MDRSAVGESESFFEFELFDAQKLPFVEVGVRLGQAGGEIDVKPFVGVCRSGIDKRKELDLVRLEADLFFEFADGAVERIFALFALACRNLEHLFAVGIAELRDEVNVALVVEREHACAAAVADVLPLGRTAVGERDVVAIHLHYSAVVDEAARCGLFFEFHIENRRGSSPRRVGSTLYLFEKSVVDALLNDDVLASIEEDLGLLVAELRGRTLVLDRLLDVLADRGLGQSHVDDLVGGVAVLVLGVLELDLIGVEIADAELVALDLAVDRLFTPSALGRVREFV